MKFIILSSPPGAGKSTYAAKLLGLNQNLIIICPDACRKTLTGSECDLSRDDYIWQHIIPEQIKVAISDGKDICFDSTAVSRRRRREIMRYCDLSNYEFERHFIAPDLQKCLKQNKLRARQVPDHVIERFCKQWEQPTLNEGFARIVEIKACVGGGKE